jgi:tripartite-type tricarboxylate transporter receptor subunit TctC
MVFIKLIIGRYNGMSSHYLGLPMRLISQLVVLCSLALSTLCLAQSAGYPNKPIKLIAPVAPGGGLDLIARLLSERLGRSLGQNVVVENVSGGGGAIASTTVAKASPDGYTLMLGFVATHGTSPAVRQLPYDAVKDFTPIAMIGGTGNVLVVPSTLPVNNLKEFLDFVKKNPGKLSYASAGAGSLTHLAMEQFKLASGIFAVHVPYRGAAPAFADLIGGQTQAMMASLAGATPHIRSGRLKPLAVTGKQRHKLYLDVPTFDELGFKGFDGVQWYGVLGPAKLPDTIVKKLNEDINRLLMTPEFKERLAGEALEMMPMTSEQFGIYIKADISRWAKLAKERKIEVD